MQDTQPRTTFRFLFPFILAILAGSFATITNGQAGRQPLQQQTDEKRSPNHLDLPVADLAAPPSSDLTDHTLRQLRGSRYDRRGVSPITEGLEAIPLITHWWRGLPALPVAQSDAVILGTVSDARAYLSNDRSSVYSEFTISIERVLKDTSHAALSSGQSIIAEREGGAVRFPSGRVQSYRVDKQGTPRTGKRYLLFLNQNDQTNDFHVITGYHFKHRIVHPLDGRELRLPFAVYDGMDEDAFLGKVREAIDQSSVSPDQERGRRR